MYGILSFCRKDKNTISTKVSSSNTFDEEQRQVADSVKTIA
jgi:hypothetical protein